MPLNFYRKSRIECSKILNFFSLRWLDTVFKKKGNLRFRSVFLENYYLFEDKEYFCYVTSKELEFFQKSFTTAVAMATMTFQNDGYFAFKVI